MSSPQFEALLGAASNRGRRATETPAALTRQLSVEDLTAAGTPGAYQSPQIKDLKQSHHTLARLVAQGEKDVVISEITGYSIGRISILKSDPQFGELVEHYKGVEGELQLRSRADFHDRLSALGFDSIETLHQRVVDEPDNFTNKELLAIVEATADRIGHGKTQTVNTNNVNVSLTAEELTTLRNEASAGTTSPARETDSFAEADRSALLRLAYRATEPHPSDEAEEGGEG